LRLLLLDDQGAISTQVTERRLTGLAASLPLVEGRRLIVATDRGHLDVFDVSAGRDEQTLSRVATREATDNQSLVRYVAVADGHLWIADRQLTKHSILPTGNRLPVVGTDNDYQGATFVHPLQVMGRTLVHVRRPRGQPGFSVAAMDGREGRVLWETALAVPLAGSPIADAAAQTITAVTASGDAYQFDATSISAGVLDKPIAAQSAPAQLPLLHAGVNLGNGRAAYSATGHNRVLIVDTSQNSPAARWITLPGLLACPLSRFGDGMLAPLSLGQVLYLNPTNGSPLAAPFQPRLEPGSTLRYSSPGTSDGTERQFAISDGRASIYLVTLADQPQPHLQMLAEEAVAGDPIVSPVVMMRDLAIGVTKSARLMRFGLPSLEAGGETKLSAPLAWGPYRVGERMFLATADGQLTCVSADGRIAWTATLAHGELVGPPIVIGDDVLVVYHKGVFERRTVADGQAAAALDVAVPLAAGPVPFLGRFVLTCHDGTLLIVDRP
jgi:outer membrane protein assembly factor BamB